MSTKDTLTSLVANFTTPDVYAEHITMAGDVHLNEIVQAEHVKLESTDVELGDHPGLVF